MGPLTSTKLTQAAVSGTPNCKTVPSPPPAPEPSTAGPPCTEALIQAAAQAASLANEKIVLTGPYQCAGVWTYNAPTISTNGGAQTQVIDLMHWNGTAWQVVNRALYCENGSVPSLIYKKTCQA